jgi:EmrB/QacA subfamily drug resistance transporter
VTSWTTAQRWVVILTAAAAAMVGLDALVVATALSTIRVDIGASIGELQWTVSAYTLTFAVLIMPAAALGDRLGRRRVCLAGLGLFAAASAACALAPGVGWLIAARAVQGAGAAAVMPLTLTLLTAAVPAPQRPRALGIYSAVIGASVPLGPLVGGAVVQGIDWRWIFWLNLPAALVLIPLIRARVGESAGTRAALDLPGLALATGAAFGLVWGLVRGNTAGWGSTEVLLTLALGAALTAAFVLRESRTAEPMLPMRLFRDRSFSAGTAAIFFLWGSALGAIFFMAQFLQTGLGYGPLGAGLRLMPWGAVVMVVPRIVGAWIPRLGERAFLVAGMSLQAVAMAWIALAAAPGLPYRQLVLPLILSGAGLAMSIPAAQSSVLAAAAPHDVGKRSGAFSTVRQLGGAFGVAVLVTVFTGTGSYASAAAFVHGFGPALAGSAGLALAAAVAGLAAPRRRPATTAAPAGAAQLPGSLTTHR